MRVSFTASISALLVLCPLVAPRASAHPSSGIVVDPQGQVFFQDSAGRAIWKIDAQGKLTKSYDTLGGHWMALDGDGRFARAERILDLRRITPAGVKPALIVADGGAPIAVNRDGNLYFGLALLAGGKVAPGVTRV